MSRGPRKPLTVATVAERAVPRFFLSLNKMRKLDCKSFSQHHQSLYWRKDLGVYKPVGGPSVDEAEKVIERLQQGSNSRQSGGHLGLTSRLNRLTVGHR